MERKMDERFGASRALKALWFCHEFFIPFHIPALNFDHGLLLDVTSKPRTPNDWWKVEESAEAFLCLS